MSLVELKGKKIAVVGLGVNNLKLAAYLKQHEIDFDVFEHWKSPDELTGKLDGYQVIFRTPGLPYLSAAVQQALKSGAEISSQTKLFFQLCPAPIIGVTGTKGKGTTSSLIAKILIDAGKKVWLGGNIGKDPFEFLDQIKSSDWVILELSSFQLQDLEQSPHIAVVLNITSDHLNHHESLDEYIMAKSLILKFQTTRDSAILHPGLPIEFAKIGLGRKVFFNPADVSNFQTKLLGRHNWENVSAAAAVAKLLQISPETVVSSVAQFEPLPHRLKIIGFINGITYIDDSFSTNIDPAVSAIEAIKSPLILITGGFNKGLDFTALGEKIKSSPNLKAVIIIGQVTQQILQAVKGFSGIILTEAETMAKIMRQAQSVAQSGDTVLFSPATSSFDMFQNETDRGEQFVNAVNSL